MQTTNAHYTLATQQLQQFSEALDEFVAQVQHTGKHVAAATEHEFITVLMQYTQVTQREICAMPVMLYLHNKQFVAFYDEELQYGFIAQ